MATIEQRVGQAEQSIVKLAANKLDIVDLTTRLAGINAQLADLQSTVSNLIDRIEVLEQYNANQIASS